MRRSALFLLSSLVPLAAGAATPPATDTSESSLLAAESAPALPTSAERVRTQGGTLTARWNDDLLRDLRMPRADSSGDTTRFAIGKSGRFEADVSGGTVLGLAGGSISLTGGTRFTLQDGALDWSSLRAIARHGKDTRIDFISPDGSVAFYADRLMWELLDEGRTFHIRSADLRIGEGLARRLGNPEAANLAVAELKASAPIADRAAGYTLPKAAGDPNWPGEQVPGQAAGTKYLADVFMAGFTGQYSRCRQNAGGGTCDGPNTATDGDVVFTPSSTLANNRNNGSAVATIGGDPLGTSTALFTADVPWYQKFTSSPNNPLFNYPYLLNDQHPFLVWNLYRLDSATGTITQIGRSGVKHAFLTTNVGSGCDTSNGNHVLGRQCGDTYGTGNNDSSSDLGPRSEIIPATGQWGRCGSIYDTNCDGTANASPNGAYDQRMIVKESQITATAGVTWLFESWYLIRDDINIYNTMGTVPWAATFGSSWSSPTGTQSPFRLGPAIDRWVAAGTSTPTARNVELAAPEGHVKVAVQAIDQGGSWRYEYAVMNFDFARAATTGKEDDHTLRVLRNNGFNSFSLPLTAGASVSALQFSDGDVNAANDWTATVLPDRIVWTAPNDASSLNWAAMYRFSFTSNAAPLTAAARLGVTEPGTPSQYEVANLLTLTPGALAVFGPTDATMLEDAASAGRTFTVFDPETLPADINVVASASDPLLFPGGSLAVTGATSDRTLSMSPAANRSGSATITITATDGDNNTATATFTANVTPVNDAPSLVLGANPVDPFGTSGARTVPGFVANVNYGPFETQSVAAYNVVETSDLSNVVSSASIALNGTLSYTLSGTAGTATLAASVRDDGGTANGGIDTSAPVVFTITVLSDTLFSDGFE